MIALLQRVCQASVEVEGRCIGEIASGLVVFVGVERGDGAAQAERLLERVLGYRVFEDDQGRMNRSLIDVRGGMLLVPQFTLAADTRKGTRPSFTPAAEPAEGKRWFDYLIGVAREAHAPVASGVFGAHMKVALVNDGPVTFWLQVT
jgi:D-tyrosyl-tRNA(Tyr) deacylase